MPVRIYALAKELKLDSKHLVDVCTNAGITGKGSALASLTDEEAEKVKEFLRGGGGQATKAAPAQRAAPGRSGPVPVVPRSSRPAPEPPTRPEQSGPVRREDYVAPAGTGGRPPVIETPRKNQEAAEVPKAPQKAPPRTGPTIKLAPLPVSDQPKAEQKPAEPAPQRPDLKLPADAIRASKAGSKPLAEHLRRHEKKRQADETRKVERTPAAGPKGAAPVGDDQAGRGAAARGRRRGKGEKEVAAATTEERPMLGGREQRQLQRKRTTGGGRRKSVDGDSGGSTRFRKRIRRMGTNTAAPRKGKVVVELPCSVRGFSEATGVPAPAILRVLLSEGVMANITAELDPEMAELVAEELDIDVEFRHAVTVEDRVLSGIRELNDEPDSLVGRPPVVTFLGHVDHGKTSLLDKIIGLDVVSGESGGITQHIRAYTTEKEGRQISFVDTPGHEAFTQMRARGATVTDIAVLVVAADDGVMPQTEEAISHARAAGVPIVVALNKCDLPGVDVNRAMQQLSANELLPSEWGGDVEVIKTSAMTGEGLDELLETLLTVAELHEYKANPDRDAFGTCLEAQQEPGRGVVAKVLVQNGTLNVGDILVCGHAYGRVKAMYDSLYPTKRVEHAGPSVPVNVTGLDVAPQAGERFYVLEDIGQAREIASQRASTHRTISLGGGREHITLENLFDRLGGVDEVQTLNIILRADVRGSIEAIQKELTKLEHPEVRIKILQATVGGITEADVHLADASDAVIIGFNVVPEEGARSLADKLGVQVRRYEVIYKVTDDLRAALEGMLRPEQREVDLGRALVQQIFTISRIGTVAGCRVLAGSILRNSRARVIRNNTIIGDYPLETLRREKDDVKEVREGMECGIKLSGFNDIKEGDVLEDYRIEEVGRTFA